MSNGAEINYVFNKRSYQSASDNNLASDLPICADTPELFLEEKLTISMSSSLEDKQFIHQGKSISTV